MLFMHLRSEQVMQTEHISIYTNPIHTVKKNSLPLPSLDFEL